MLYDAAFVKCEKCGGKSVDYITSGYYGISYTEREIIQDWNEKLKILTDEPRHGHSVKRAIRILLKVGCMSPSLRRRVRISDIWRTPWYGG